MAMEQSGPVVPFHLAVFTEDGVAADAGTPNAPAISARGIFGGAVVAGGSTNTVPVYSDGMNWRIG
jgi:hypothetical protein